MNDDLKAYRKVMTTVAANLFVALAIVLLVVVLINYGWLWRREAMHNNSFLEKLRYRGGRRFPAGEVSRTPLAGWPNGASGSAHLVRGCY